MTDEETNQIKLEVTSSIPVEWYDIIKDNIKVTSSDIAQNWNQILCITICAIQVKGQAHLIILIKQVKSTKPSRMKLKIAEVYVMVMESLQLLPLSSVPIQFSRYRAFE